MMYNTLKELCLLNGTSGREEKIREYIINKIGEKGDITVDSLGNVIAFVKGRNRPKNKVMISAHMDEVGFIVRYITDDGYLKITPVGGVDERVVYGRNLVVGDNEISGVVCVKPVHLLEGDEKQTCPSVKDMFVDIGASSKEEAEKYVKVGDSAYFVSDYVEFGNSFIKAKAIDDRFGCAAMLRMIEEGIEYDTYFAFLVQEEVGCRGAKVAAYSVDPDYAIVLEATTAADVANVSDMNSVCRLGEGAVVSFMDNGTLYDSQLYGRSYEIARENSIKWQTKTAVAGSNDASAIHLSRGGVYTLAISIPCRYIHSATCVANKEDMQSVYELAVRMSEDFADA